MTLVRFFLLLRRPFFPVFLVQFAKPDDALETLRLFPPLLPSPLQLCFSFQDVCPSLTFVLKVKDRLLERLLDCTVRLRYDVRVRLPEKL